MGAIGRKIKRVEVVPVPEPREAPVQEPEPEREDERQPAAVPA